MFSKTAFFSEKYFFDAKGKGFFLIRAEAWTFILRNPMIKQTTKRAHALHISKNMTAFRLRVCENDGDFPITPKRTTVFF